MILLNAKGKPVNKSVVGYLIDWDAKSLSLPQAEVKRFLKPFWRHNMVYEEFPVYGTRLSVDILNATKKIAVEVHGPQHEEFHYFHNKSRISYLTGIKNDVAKSQWLELNGFKLLVIYTREVSELSEQFFFDKFGITL